MYVKARIRLLFSAIVAFCTAVVVVIIGKYVCESYLLFIIASLAFSNFVAIITEFIMLHKTTSKEDDSAYTFGFVRAGLIGTVVNQIFLFGLFFNVLVESVQSFIKLTVANETTSLIPNTGIDGFDEFTTPPAVTHHDGHHGSDPHDNPRLVGYQVLFVSIGALVVQVFVVLLYHLHGYLWQKLSCTNSLGPQAEALIADPYFNINPWTKFFHNWQNHQISMDDVGPIKPKSTGHPLYNKAWVRTFFLDVSGAFFACVVAICSSFVWLYGSEIPNYHLVDPALSIIVVMFVVGTRAPILRDTMLILLQTLPRGVSTDRLGKRIVNEVDGITSIHEMHLWQLTSKRLVATVHLSVSNKENYMKIAADVKHIFHQEGIHSLTMQPEFVENSDEPEGTCLLGCSVEDDEEDLLDCSAHQCCQEPIVVIPDSRQIDGGNSNVLTRRSLMNPPNEIPMIDSTSTPNTPTLLSKQQVVKSITEQSFANMDPTSKLMEIPTGSRVSTDV